MSKVYGVFCLYCWWTLILLQKGKKNDKTLHILERKALQGCSGRKTRKRNQHRQKLNREDSKQKGKTKINGGRKNKRLDWWCIICRTGISDWVIQIWGQSIWISEQKITLHFTLKWFFLFWFGSVTSLEVKQASLFG